MRTLNLGILAHVDAGKTSLTERLLHGAGVIDEIGRVDDGNTRTDTLALERQRGITIRSAVVSFVVDDVVVNLIDTPGHPDFIAEVERVLDVLDGAVLVISAVEGVQAQTRILMRALQRLRVPTLIFVNKIDRAGADIDRTLDAIRHRLSAAVVPMGSTVALGTAHAGAVPFDAADAGFTTGLTELLAEQDETLLAAYVDGAVLSSDRLGGELARQAHGALVHPVLFGSAITGAGVEQLMAAMTTLLPATDGDRDAPLSGAVFKVERGPAGERVAYARLFAGVLRSRDRLRLRGEEQTVTGIAVFDHGSARPASALGPGRIGKLRGLSDVRIGDVIGTARPGATAEHHFAPPTLEAVIVPHEPARKGALHAALAQLAEQDPLIDLRQDDVRHELHVSLYGEVQKSVIQAMLAGDHGIDVDFRETTTVCIERPVGVGEALEVRGKGVNPFAASVGLRIGPAAPGSGLVYRSEIGIGSIPRAFLTAVQETTRDTLRQGLHGWEVTDCLVTLTVCDPRPPPVPVGGFRDLTPLVAMAALARAGTTVCEPIHRFRLELPGDSVSAALAVLARLGAAPDALEPHGSSWALEGEIRAARVDELQRQVPGLTGGEGVMESAFDCYRPVTGEPPTRPRSDRNPRNRDEYLLHVGRRVQTGSDE